MSENFERRTYSAGQVIFNEGDLGAEMFLILQGKVKISRGGSVLGYLTDGEIFGEMALIVDQPRLASATSECDTTVEIVSKDEFRGRFKEVNGFVRALIKLLAMNIRSLSDHVESKR